jgi:hypothetical protein
MQAREEPLQRACGVAQPRVELTDEYAIFAIWPTEQDRIAVTHLMGIPDLVWDKEEDGMYYMKRAQYDMCNEQL